MRINKKILFVIIFFSIAIIALILFYHTIADRINQTNKVNSKTTNTLFESKQTFEKFFVPVTYFGSLQENISSQELKDILISNHSERFDNVYILEETRAELDKYFGLNTSAIGLGSADNLLEIISASDLALVPLDMVSPKLKTVTVDGQNIFDKSIPNSEIIYPKIEIIVSKKLGIVSNRNTDKMKQISVTGVTAISRTVQKMIDIKKDPLYPAREVMDVLSKSDIVVVNSENPFFEGCPPNEAESLVLCAKASSLESLKAIGTNVVDLAGNHQNDFGQDKFIESIDLMKSAGFDYFGGGKNSQEASRILYKNIGENKIAFLSYAYFDSLNGPGYRNIASESRAGVNFYDVDKVANDIKEAKNNSDFVIVNYQFTESYNYSPLREQNEVFQNTIEMGADAIFGVQAHQPQKIEFYGDGIIFYGLGNFFFDQMWSEPTRQGIIPRLNFINGKLVNIDIMTTLLFDYSQPKIVYGKDREKILSEILPKN